MIAQRYIPAIRRYGMYSILHIGNQCLQYAKELASFAQNSDPTTRPDAIAMMPPFAPEGPANLAGLVQLLQVVAAEAPTLPFFYYHIPGITGLDFKMADLLKMSVGLIPTMSGIKFVNYDLPDFANALSLRTCKGPACDSEGRYRLFWAPNPKAQGLPFGARGFVLAQSFLARWDRTIYNAWPNETAVWSAQTELTELSNIFGEFNDGDRYMMKMLNIDLGPPRLPRQPMPEADFAQLKQTLTQWGFFQKVPPFKRMSK